MKPGRLLSISDLDLLNHSLQAQLGGYVAREIKGRAMVRTVHEVQDLDLHERVPAPHQKGCFASEVIPQSRYRARCKNSRFRPAQPSPNS